MTEEDRILARRIMEKTLSCTVRPQDVFDERAYKKLISTHTVRCATDFLNDEGCDQSNALLRLKFSYEENGFKTFQAPRLNQEIERCRRARRQEYLMKSLMGQNDWPAELLDVRTKLLQSSSFDFELDKCDDDTNFIIGSPISAYRQKRPLEAGLRWQLYLRHFTSTEPTSENHSHPLQRISSGSAGDGVTRADPATSREADSSANSIAEGPESGAGICPLSSLRLECLNMSLERYSLMRRSEDEKFHVVLGDPTLLQLNGTCKVVLDYQMADKCVGILKLLVREHGWVFSYTSPVDFAMWNKAFNANGFAPLAYPWVVVRNTDTIQMNTSPIPQNITELLIGPRKSGNGRPEYQPNITSNYLRLVSSRKRKFAIMDNCSEPRLKVRKPNTREPIWTNQRSAEPIAEFLETLCPSDGFVLDAFAGKMETAKACYMTGRKCVALEADHVCYEAALEMLNEYVRIALGNLPLFYEFP